MKQRNTIKKHDILVINFWIRLYSHLATKFRFSNNFTFMLEKLVFTPNFA